MKAEGTSERRDITGPSDADMIVRVDVSSVADVKRLELIEVSDSDGLGLDDLEFDFPN